MSDVEIDKMLDEDTIDRLDSISDDITPSWMDNNASKAETIRYLAQFYHGEADV